MLRITRRLKARSLAMLLLAVVSLSWEATAQTEAGQIGGRVLSPQGAAIAGATVTVKSVGTGAVRTATTSFTARSTNSTTRICTSGAARPMSARSATCPPSGTGTATCNSH